MLTWDHGGGFSLDGSVHIEASDRALLERLIRYCARAPFALGANRPIAGLDLFRDKAMFFIPKVKMEVKARPAGGCG